MIITVPLVVDSSMLVSSSVPEPDASQGELLWSPGTSYAVGNTTVRATTHRKYLRLAESPGINAGLPENTPLLWADAGPTNRHAMFQHDRNTQTIGASPLVVVLAIAKRVDTFALLGLQAANSHVVQQTTSATVYNKQYGLTRRNTKTATDYCFGGFKQLKSLLKTDLPPYANTTLTVTLTNGSQPVKCAGLVVNKSVYVGRVQADNESDARNFSDIERDDFGGLIVRRKRSVPLGAFTIYVDKHRVDELIELRDEEINGVPALFSGLDDRSTDGYFGMSLLMGLYTQFKINARHPRHAVMTLKVEET